MSSIYNKGGYYYYQTYIYNHKIGKKDKKQIALRTRNHQEALRLQKDWDLHFKKMQSSNPFQKPPQPFIKLVEEFIDDNASKYKINDISQSTYRINKDNIRLFSEWYLDNYGNKQIQRVSTTEIEQYRLYRKGRNLSDNTIRINLRTIRTFFEWCVKNKYIAESPFTSDIVIPSYKRRLDENVPMGKDWDRIYQFTEKSLDKSETNDDDWLWYYNNWWFKHMLWILLNTGMRIGEVRIIQWAKDKQDSTAKRKSFVYLNPKMTEFFIYFKGNGSKLPVPKNIHKSLSELKDITGSSKYVFQSEKTDSVIEKSVTNKYFRRLMKQLELVDKSTKNALYTPHSLRHGYVSRLLKNDSNIYSISKILRHTDIRTTLNIYGHLLTSDILETMENIDN